MKKLAAIALLLVFLVNTMGYFVVFHYSRFMARQEMIERIRSGQYTSSVSLLKIIHPEKSSHFRRVENKEISWYGNLYDIVDEHRHGDTTLFYCIHDAREQNLLADYTLFVHRRSESTPKDNSILALLYSFITQALIQGQPVPMLDEGIVYHFPIPTALITPVYLVHFAPPPEA